MLGSFSGRNIGDDAIIRGMIQLLRLITPHFEILLPTKFPAYFDGFSPHLKPFRSRTGLLSMNTFRNLHKSDLILLPQGSLFSHQFFNPFYNRVLTYNLALLLNKVVGKKPAGLFFAQIGPLHTRLSEFFAGRVLRELDFIVLRDTQSIRYLEKFGIKTRPVIAADVALFCGPVESDFTRAVRQKIGSRKAVGININKYTNQLIKTGLKREDLLAVSASFLNRFNSRYLWIFLPSDLEDLATMKELLHRSGLAENDYLFIEKCRPEEYIAIQSMCECFIGARMHSLIMGSAAPTPMIGLNYNPKVRDFLESLGMGEYCIEYDDLSTDLLAEKFFDVVQNREHLRAQVGRAVEVLKQRILLALNREIAPLLNEINQGSKNDHP